MYSLRHVLWRGAMALSLLALGIGGGFGFQQAPQQAAQAPACDSPDPHMTRKAGLLVDADALAMTVVVRASRKRG